MGTAEMRNASWRAGVSGNPQTTGRGLSLKDAQAVERMQHRLSGFALALDAVLPEVAFLEQAVELTARGLPLPAGGQVRLHRLALRMFDLRVVLEHPSEVQG